MKSGKPVESYCRESFFKPGSALVPEYDTPACTRNGVINRFFCSPRTERAFRFVSLLPVAMYLAYENPQGYTFAYLVIVFYVIVSALMPPSPSGFVLAVTMGLPASLIAVCCSQMILLVVIRLVEHGVGHAGIDAYVIVSVFIAAGFFSVLKLGSLGSLLQIGLFAGIYTLASILILTYTTVRDGAELDLPPASLAFLIQELDAIIKQISDAGLNMLAELIKFVIPLLVNNLPCPLIQVDPATSAITILDTVCHFAVPDSILKVDSSLRALIGVPIDVRASPAKGIWIHLNPGTWALKFMWLGKRKFALVQGLLAQTSIALALFFAALLIPPPRFMKSLFRSGVVTSTKNLKNTDITWATDFMLVDRKEVLANGVLPPPINEVTQRPLMRREIVGGFFRSRRYTGGDVPSEQVATKADDLKGPMILSLFEHLLFSPFGVNTFLVAPVSLKALKKNAVHIGFLGEITRLRMTPKGAIRRHSGSAVRDGLVLRWMQLAVMDSIRLAQVTELAFSLKNAANMDKSQRSLMTDTATRLRYEMERVQFRKEQFEREYQRAIIIALSENRRPADASFLVCQFAYTFMDSQLELANAASKWLDNQMTRKFRLLLFSIAGFFTPALLFLISMVKPWIHGLKRILSPCVKSLRKPPTPDVSFVLNNAAVSSDSPRSPFPALVRSLRNFSRFTAWSSVALRLKSRQRKHSFTDLHSFWICVRFVIGATAIFALVILLPSYSEKKWLGGSDTETISLPGLPPNFLSFNIPVLHIAKTAAWTFLGFLTTFICTMEGTLKRGVLRMIGVVTGSGMAWLCLLAFPRSGIAQCIWMVIVDFVVVWISVNPNSPFGGFHPSWGYSAQLFTYQQAIIVCETTILAPKYNRNEITVDRLLSQTIGITIAVACSLVVNPSRAGPTVRLYLSDSVYAMSQTTRALIELYSVPKQTYKLESNTVERKNADQWQKHYDAYIKYMQHDVDTANSYRTDNAILKGFTPLKNHPALDVIYNSCQRLIVIREEAAETLKSIWTDKDEDEVAPINSGNQLETSSHTISIYADQPRVINSEDSEYPTAWQTPRAGDRLLSQLKCSPRDYQTEKETAAFEPSPAHGASPPEDRFLRARHSGRESLERPKSIVVERVITPVSAFSIHYDMTSCGVQTADMEPGSSVKSASLARSPQPSLSSPIELSIGKAVLAERDEATREKERLQEENDRQREETAALGERVKELEEQLAERETALPPPLLLKRAVETPKEIVEADEEEHREFLNRLGETRQWLSEEGDEERYSPALAAIVLVFERLYVIVENGLQWGGRKQRSSFPMLSSEFEQSCRQVLDWLREMVDEIASRAATEIAVLSPQASLTHRPSPTSTRDVFKLYCDETHLAQDVHETNRVIQVAFRMRALTHFMSLEILELNRVVELITSELWDKARLRSIKTVNTERL